MSSDYTEGQRVRWKTQTRDLPGMSFARELLSATHHRKGTIVREGITRVGANGESERAWLIVWDDATQPRLVEERFFEAIPD